MIKLKTLFRRNVRPSVPRRDGEEAFYRALAEQACDVIAHVGPDDRIDYISPSVETLLGWLPEAFIGKDVLGSVIEEDRARVAETIVKLKSGQVADAWTQARVRRADGSTVWIETTARLDAAGDGSAVLVLRDITTRKQLEEELAKLALQDALTGLANRRSFDQALEREWDRTVREEGQMALLLIDIDQFKLFNDEYGHQAGDDCLRSVATCIRSQLSRSTDTAFRYGGEEMAVVLGGTGREGAMEVALRLRQAVIALSIPHARSSAARHVTISIGVATAVSRDGGSMRMPEGLLQAADHALYRAKAEGRNQVSEALLFAPARNGHAAV